MIPPSVHPELLPRKHRVDPFRIALANAAAEPRTLEELEMERTQLDQKRCDTGKYTVPQRRAFNQEKKHLDNIIRDKRLRTARLCLLWDRGMGRRLLNGFLAPNAESKRRDKGHRCAEGREGL
jgi:hypothetical protein